MFSFRHTSGRAEGAIRCQSDVKTNMMTKEALVLAHTSETFRGGFSVFVEKELNCWQMFEWLTRSWQLVACHQAVGGAVCSYISGILFQWCFQVNWVPVCVCVCGYLWYMNMCVYCTCYQHALSAVCECVTVMPFTGRGQTLTCLSEQKNKSEHIWVLKTSTINKKRESFLVWIWTFI